MLISFSVSNYRSFRSEQTLSMVASNRLGTHHPNHGVSLEGTEHKLLPLAILYGANASGKSNWVKALDFVKTLVLLGTGPESRIPRDAFRLAPDGLEQPSEFEVRFVADGRGYSYGFACTDTEIISEWLDVLKGESEQSLFERETGANGVNITLGPALRDPKLGDHSKAADLIEVGTRRNQLVLSTIRQAFDPGKAGPLLDAVLKWFGNRVQPIFPDTPFGRLADFLTRDNPFTEFAGRFLAEVSTGITGLRVKTRNLKPEQLPLEEKVFERLSGGSLVPLGPGLSVGKGEDGQWVEKVIEAEHPGAGDESVIMPLNEESDGTVRLLHLLPALFSSAGFPSVYVIDEIDRSLHPLLAKKFVEFFLKNCQSRGSQLILTTHEVNLLDLDVIRRDEVWFTEKKPDGSTELYSLSDFQVRQDLKVQKHYLQGRFGAIPFLGNVERLLEPAATS